MNFGPKRVSAVSVLVALVMLLLPALAWMQYRWLGQLSEAERERMQRTLRTAAAQFATEFDTELSRLLINLQVDGATIRDQNWTAYAQRYSAWSTSAAEPRIVRDVWLVDTLPGTALPAFGTDTPIPTDRLRIRRWNVQAMAFEGTEWPADLEKARPFLAQRFIGFTMQRGRANDNTVHRETIALSVGDDTTLISPVTLFEMPDDHRGPPRISILGFTIVRLEPAVIRDTMLAALTARHFDINDTEVNYRVAVVEREDHSKLVWESEPGIAKTVLSSPDVSQTFMGPRPDQMFIFARGMRDGVALPLPPPPPPAPLTGSREPGAGSRETVELRVPAPDSPLPAPGSRLPDQESKVVVSMVERGGNRVDGRIITRAGQLGPEGRWVLMAKHRAGSLEAAVAAVRARNLMISSGVLLLLAAAIGLIVVSARRAQALARQQMEFVAAVSHELRTPVSVIGAAAGNLADGVVGDPQRVRKYGETIQGEARRLAETVERVLQLAGIAAGRAAATQTLVNPTDLVREALAECRPEIEAAGVTVETSIADDLPLVTGDLAALRSALRNLISNAVKYGGPARWVRVSATLADTTSAGRHHMVAQSREWRSASKKVFFTVEDRGLGIDAEDRKHVFEPFYRGREAVSQQIQGSGLGLNLVMQIIAAHGGRVTLNSEPGKGSTFTMSLPAAELHDKGLTEQESINLARQAPSPR